MSCHFHPVSIIVDGPASNLVDSHSSNSFMQLSKLNFDEDDDKLPHSTANLSSRHLLPPYQPHHLHHPHSHDRPHHLSPSNTQNGSIHASTLATPLDDKDSGIHGSYEEALKECLHSSEERYIHVPSDQVSYLLSTSRCLARPLSMNCLTNNVDNKDDKWIDHYRRLEVPNPTLNHSLGDHSRDDNAPLLSPLTSAVLPLLARPGVQSPHPSLKCLALSLENLDKPEMYDTPVIYRTSSSCSYPLNRNSAEKNNLSSTTVPSSTSLDPSRQLNIAKALLNNRKCSVNSLAEANRLVTSTNLLLRNNSRRDRFENYFCRIQVLLVVMQLALGLSMTWMGLFLQHLTTSLTFRDCTYWASAPLLLLGIFGIYFCLPSRFHHQPYFQLRKIMQIITVPLACLCIILCLAASLLSGSHGNWISHHSSSCDDKNTVQKGRDPCCQDTGFAEGHTNHFHGYSPNNSCTCFSPHISTTRMPSSFPYEGLKCRYVSSALKDYLILQCALLFIGAGVSLWFVVLITKSSFSWETNNKYQSSSYVSHSLGNISLSTRHDNVPPIQVRISTSSIPYSLQNNRQLSEAVSTRSPPIQY